MSEWKKVKIAEVCTIGKGATGLASATPGKYPMDMFVSIIFYINVKFERPKFIEFIFVNDIKPRLDENSCRGF
jgi:hypothetical protein